MTLRIFKKSPLVLLYIGGAALLIAAAVLWCTKISMNPERVFWGTLGNSLATNGVTVNAQQESNGTDAEQIMRYSFGADNLSHSVTILKQGSTKVVNEMIGTPTVDYTRYVSIKTDQKRSDGSNMDFSRVVGVWAESQAGQAQFFSQAVFGSSLPIGGLGVPVGNMPADKRQKLLEQIQSDKVYTVDFSKVKKQRVNGRLQYTYSATVSPSGYIAMMQQYSGSMGLHSLDQVNPEDYKEQQAFVLEITVDARSRQLVRISAPGSGVEQSFSGYGVPVQIGVPDNTISGEELQKRLSDLQ